MAGLGKTLRSVLLASLQRDQPFGSWPTGVSSKDSASQGGPKSSSRDSSSSTHGNVALHFWFAIRVSGADQGCHGHRIVVAGNCLRGGSIRAMSETHSHATPWFLGGSEDLRFLINRTAASRG